MVKQTVNKGKVQKQKKAPPPLKTKYRFTSLIIPQCQINSLVRVVTPDVTGVFTVEKLVYEGNNYGGNFDMTGEIYA